MRLQRYDEVDLISFPFFFFFAFETFYDADAFFIAIDERPRGRDVEILGQLFRTALSWDICSRAMFIAASSGVVPAATSSRAPSAW